MARKKRILLSSNAPWSPSGYAQQIYDFLPALRDAGYEVAIVCFYGLEGGKIQLDGITCYPRIGDVWGTDAVVAHQKDFNADLVITFQDTWIMDLNMVKQFKNWIAMAPIDMEPVPPAVFEHLKHTYRVVTHSKFGQQMLKDKGMNSTYIPLLVNTEVYKPYNKTESRKLLGIPEDIFLFGMVAANKDNPPRKSFQEALDAFAVFHKEHPKSGMYFHTLLQQQGGFPIQDYARHLGLESAIYSIEPYDLMFKVDKPKMAAIYSAFDCLLAPSTNEGFGVPIIEAQSCGVPVITNNFTSMPELIVPGKTGELCEVLYKRFTPLLSYVGVPDAKSLTLSMEKIFTADREKMGKAARAHIVKNYDFSITFKKSWVPFLEKVCAELGLD